MKTHQHVSLSVYVTASVIVESWSEQTSDVSWRRANGPFSGDGLTCGDDVRMCIRTRNSLLVVSHKTRQNLDYLDEGCKAETKDVESQDVKIYYQR